MCSFRAERISNFSKKNYRIASLHRLTEVTEQVNLQLQLITYYNKIALILGFED